MPRFLEIFWEFNTNKRLLKILSEHNYLNIFLKQIKKSEIFSKIHLKIAPNTGLLG